MVSMTALKTIQNIVPIGTELWLLPGCDAWDNLKSGMPSHALDSATSSRAVLLVRLNVPDVSNADPTMLYVSVNTKRSLNGTTSGITIPVKQCNLVTRNSPGDFVEITYIMVQDDGRRRV